MLLATTLLERFARPWGWSRRAERTVLMTRQTVSTPEVASRQPLLLARELPGRLGRQSASASALGGTEGQLRAVLITEAPGSNLSAAEPPA